jgi:hypothetical protein
LLLVLQVSAVLQLQQTHNVRKLRRLKILGTRVAPIVRNELGADHLAGASTLTRA